jgi:hypothetical protein
MSASNAIGFGFIPGETAHCFVVAIPTVNHTDVLNAAGNRLQNFE